MIAVHNKFQLKKLRERKPYMGATKNYTIDEKEEFKAMVLNFIKQGNTIQSSRFLASKVYEKQKKEQKMKKSIFKVSKENSDKLLNKDVVVVYKSSEIFCKIIRGNDTHLIVKVERRDKPLWLDRRYIEYVNIESKVN